MKVRLTLEETVRYTAEIIIEQPKTVSNAYLGAIIKSVENRCRKDGQAKDVAYFLEHELDIKVVEVNDNFPNYPDSSELKIIDVSEMRE